MKLWEEFIYRYFVCWYRRKCTARNYGISASVAMHCCVKEMNNTTQVTTTNSSVGNILNTTKTTSVLEWRETIEITYCYCNSTSDSQLPLVVGHLLFRPAEPWIAVGFGITTIFSFRIDWLSPTRKISGGYHKLQTFSFSLHCIVCNPCIWFFFWFLIYIHPT